MNLTGCFLTCKHGIRALLASGGGSVVISSSPTGLFGVAPGFDAYSASKAGTYGLTRVMAHDFAGSGIRVNCVLPGFTDTALVAPIMTDATVRDSLLEKIPLGRPGPPKRWRVRFSSSQVTSPPTARGARWHATAASRLSDLQSQ